ncbi:peptide deformylase [Candidatus Pacearchaeota archaeon]|nr:peptide deformylase [Candidatus Pacearchaeota archaeon]
MSELKIEIFPSKSLNTPAEVITNITDEIIALTNNMSETMYRSRGIGLAANQVNVLKRVIVADTGYLFNESTLHILCNPVISESHNDIIVKEGCLSFPEITISVVRASNVVVKALNIHENEIEFEASGLLAVCLQHEIDHINGITFFDKISNLGKKIANDKLIRVKKKIARMKKKNNK